MSTRLLLAGPPGTGKTTFARALANTLQVKLLVTSVGTWLEPSHLGDVLARMSSAFAEAEANAPCILFVDEIDGIGRRGSGNREYDDYWISVVNRALELVDGSVKTQGVIILGATNHPQAIDSALLRSGRLETRIDIPLPDVDALVGILRHHLGNDAAAVVASAGATTDQEVAPGAAVSGAAATQPPSDAVSGDGAQVLPHAMSGGGGACPAPGAALPGTFPRSLRSAVGRIWQVVSSPRRLVRRWTRHHRDDRTHAPQIEKESA